LRKQGRSARLMSICEILKHRAQKTFKRIATILFANSKGPKIQEYRLVGTTEKKRKSVRVVVMYRIR
jgi:hypothetical protein